MTIAIKIGFLDDDPVVDENGGFAGRGAGGAIAGRLFTIFPEAVLVGPQDRQVGAITMRTLQHLDPRRDLIINLDVLDSIGLFQRLHRSGAEPRILNIQWLPPSHFHHKVNFAAMGLSFALFPTLCSGERTAGEVSEIVRRWTIPPLAHQARIGWFHPGIRDDLLRPHTDPDVPVVLYPAIHLVDSKKPKIFLKVVRDVASRMPLKMEARLAQRDLASVMAMKMSNPRWAKVSPLFGEKEEYWESLSHATAFLATAHEEAYGMEYLEALLAGAVGIFPHQPWAAHLVPAFYPYLYATEDQAADMLQEVLSDPAAARKAVDDSAGGSLKDWILANHTRAEGNEALRAQIADWFPEVG
ncbi:hypothetical protein C0Z10_06635 [Acidipropionibacterium jensenii]|uniref:Glycosyltransferase family 1 protein n=1 Tax=Acidipropionibacterium jensenii TaxID=1749 RepID=A0A3Q9UE13_9ACTN|nr:hypothetical protein [Acidipropionibacterium jensenii]AZZ39478.1 hypothetical protein C0Z10_06635 [Acidipropionibacterium jensenii]